MSDWDIDFGIHEKEFDFGLKKQKPQKFDPKDPFGMNQLADGMKKDLNDTIQGIGKDVKQFKDEISPLYQQGKSFIQKYKKKLGKKEPKSS